MRHRPARRLTAVEILIILAVVGIIFARAVPRRLDPAQHGRTHVTRTRSTEGAHNTVELPESRKQTSGPGARGAGGGWWRTMGPVVVLAVLVALVPFLLRRGRGKKQGPRRRHPPHAEE